MEMTTWTRKTVLQEIQAYTDLATAATRKRWDRAECSFAALKISWEVAAAEAKEVTSCSLQTSALLWMLD